jgi:hypothetical protein
MMWFGLWLVLKERRFGNEDLHREQCIDTSDGDLNDLNVFQGIPLPANRGSLGECCRSHD